MAYAELHTHSNFSFLDGASHPEELAAEAVRLGLSAVAGSGFGNFGASSSSVDASNCKQAQIVAQDQSPYTAPPESSFTLYVFVRYVFVFVRSF